MDNQVLTVSQMRELIKMGVDTSKASMCWNYNDENSYWALVVNYTHSPYIEGEIVPTFTLQDILTILKKQTYTKDGAIVIMEAYGSNWLCGFNFQTAYDGDYTTEEQFGNSPLEAAFNMLKWCKQNNYI